VQCKCITVGSLVVVVVVVVWLFGFVICFYVACIIMGHGGPMQDDGDPAILGA
jgi:hypothetical protein